MTIGKTNVSNTIPKRIIVTLSDGASGVTVTASSSGSTYSATTDSNGVATIIVGDVGTYSVKATNYKTMNITTTDGAYCITLLSDRFGIACVEIDKTNSDPLACCSYPQTVTINGVARENSCYGFTKASGTDEGCLGPDWSEHSLLASIRPVVSDGGSTPVFTDAPLNPADWTTGSEYFTQFGAMWYCIETDGNTVRVIISDLL